MAVDTKFGQCYNRNKLGNTAKFAKTRQVEGLLQNKLTSIAQSVILQASQETVDRNCFWSSLTRHILYSVLGSDPGTICKQIRLPTPLGTLCEQRGAAYAQQSEFMKQDVDTDLVPGSSEQRRRMQAVMTVQTYRRRSYRQTQMHNGSLFVFIQ